ncbi:hypothetical protein F5Y16DRAFT_399859 [Xylariaceae sp. FL0255]|nr:hypothetical protein F5Y16DRAFT_399859 [Xylariaceae sp. FL0255]
MSSDIESVSGSRSGSSSDSWDRSIEFPTWIEPPPFDVSTIPEFGDKRADRAAEIIKRAKYKTFTDPLIRGIYYGRNMTFDKLYHPIKEVLDKNNQHNFKDEYFRPNPTLERLPERWLAETLHPGKKRMVEQCINNIKHPEKIKKMVCIGFGLIATHPVILLEDIGKHSKLQQMTNNNQKIELYAVDPDYDKYHEEFLTSLEPIAFAKILNPSYELQEHWPVIDDSTFLFVEEPGLAPVKSMVMEYARPAAMLCVKHHYEDLVQDYDGKPSVEDEKGPLYPFDAQWIEIPKAPGSDEKVAIPISR